MCGIVGILGKGDVARDLVDALKRLEYRGYDSAGIATIHDGRIDRRRAEGKLKALQALVDVEPLPGKVGIGHTRWATHGAPSVRNAHPHSDGQVVLVHNGIIENFRELREGLAAEGIQPQSDTDTETVVHLVSRELKAGHAPLQAVENTLKQLEGAFALAILFTGEEDLLIGARRGSPLAVGHGDGEMYLGSDAFALAPFTDNVTYLEEGDYVVLTRKGATIRDEGGAIVTREMKRTEAKVRMIDKGNHRHFMMKEIHEQPEVIAHTLARYVDMTTGRVKLPTDRPFSFKDVTRLSIAACGTAFLAGSVAKYWFERFAGLPVEIDIASEFRYRDIPLASGGMALFISQSGETADTLASLQHCRSAGQTILSVVNVPESSIARDSDFVFPTLAGPEIGVASTKAFTCQLTVLAALAIAAGRDRGILSVEDEEKLVHALLEAPRFMVEALKLEDAVEDLARELMKASDVLYLGRGTSYPLALEGALKLKEISYIHAEGYAAGELKHGPIALIDETMPVVVIAPYDRVFDKTVSNMQEVAARGGRIILLTDAKGAAAASVDHMTTLILPEVPATIAPIVYSVPIQLLAYHVAVLRGTDVDQPRNLAKSVTVE